MSDQFLAWLVLYGLPVLFVTLAISAIGVPIPAMLLLLAVGSFVAQGEMTLWKVIVVASVGAIAGDQIGYWLGRWGGRRLVRRVSARVGGAGRFARAEAFARRWGGASVFLSRWLVSPLGPWVNLSSGIATYSWPRFLLWGASGEVVWVVLYVTLGRVFSDRVVGLADLLNDFAWVILGALAAIVLGWELVRHFRAAEAVQEES